MDRTERQQLAVRRILENNDHSVIEFPTGVGKTKTAIMLCKALEEIHGTLKCIHIAVPTNYLKQKWAEEMQQEGFEQTEVYTMVSYARMRNEYRDPDVLIVDEIHNCAGENKQLKSQVLNSPAAYAVGLSATLDNDQKQFLSKRGWSVADRMELGEALSNAYIPDYTVYNLGLKLEPEEQAEYDRTDNRCKELMNLFGFDFQLIQKCTNSPEVAESYRQSLGNQGRELTAQQVQGYAVQTMKLIRRRKEICHAAEQKVRAIHRINDIHNEKGIVFGQTNAFADRLEDEMDDVLAYHSKMPPFKRKKQFERFMDSKMINLLATSQVFNEGVDLPELNLGIVASYTSNHRELVQRIGRLLRGNQPSIYVFYMIGTQEEKWLSKAQQKVPRRQIIEITPESLKSK